MARRLTWRSLATLATAAGIVFLSTFANLASGAARIDERRSHGRIAVVGPKLAPVRSLAAGDTAQRVLEVKTGGRARATLTVSVRKPSPLVDPTLGVQLKIERCSKSWRAKRGAYTCSGRTTLVTGDRPAVGRHVLRKLARRGKNHLRLTLALPRSAPNALQGQSAQLVYRFR